eukprot:3157610-Rhodomonas_salina.1
MADQVLNSGTTHLAPSPPSVALWATETLGRETESVCGQRRRREVEPSELSLQHPLDAARAPGALASAS